MQPRFLTSIRQVPSAHWNALAGTDYPFTRHEFLAALEDSGACSAHSGWQAQHLVIYRGEQLLLAVPGYIKTHSFGEYVFDWAWADAYQRFGKPYYPKLINAIPFTPCQGPRILGNPKDQTLAVAVSAVHEHCQRLGLSGWHCLFPSAALSEQLLGQQTRQRVGCQFHWHNRGYQNFTDFIATFTSRKRKNVLKERRRVREQGFYFQHLRGGAITAAHWRFFYDLYRLTYLKRSGHSGYLNEAFFLALGKHLPAHCVMVIAKREDRSVAAALYLQDRQTLYGRYWGCLGEFDFLHFETCYYQGIDYAIAQGLERFDGGAQGEHKIARGFAPVLTYSNHWLADATFSAAIDDFLQQERAAIQHYCDQARAHLPYAQHP